MSPTTVRNVIKRNRMLPASGRSSSSWGSFLGHYKDQMLACDFFTVETITLQTIYVLFFIDEQDESTWLAARLIRVPIG